jgi:hypothetical protein
MFINISSLILLTFFHMLFSEFSDILHCEDDFSFFEFVNSILIVFFLNLTWSKLIRDSNS